MTEALHNCPREANWLRNTILDEIIGSEAAQAAIDELGLAMATHPGSKRDRNEDRIAVARISAPNAETYTVAIVCDGVGGSELGEQAAALAIASIIADLAQQEGRPSLNDLVSTIVRRADDRIRTELQGRGATTLVMLLATATGDLVCASVGDSRAYNWDPISSKLDQVTIDDTIENELKGLPGNGASLIEARGLKGRLSQAIGEDGRATDDLRIQIYTKRHFPGGAMLGSDGLWRAAKDFETAVANAGTPTDAVRRAIALANWVGGVDNASLIAVVDVERLCGGRQLQALAGRRQLGVALWLSSVKIKIPTGEWIRAGNRAPPRGKPDKQTSRPKKTAQRETGSELQLKLEAGESFGARPKIEVVINEEPKSNS